MRKLGILFLLFLFLSASRTAHSGQKRALSVDDLFLLKDVEDVHISPDGRWVAFVVSGKEEAKDERWSNIYRVSVEGGIAQQVTFSGKDSSPRWSPDNRYLSFLSSRGKAAQVFLLNRSGGEAQQLTDVTQGVDRYEWSPDGKKMLLVLTDPDPADIRVQEGKAPPPYVITRLFFKFDGIGYLKELYRHLYVMDLETRKIRQITFGPYDDAEHLQSDSDFSNPPRWSPDGKSIVFVSNRTPEPDSNTNTDLFVVSVDGGEPKLLTTNAGADQMPEWSPDGKSIVYVTSLEPRYLWFDQLEVAVVSAEGGTARILTGDLDRNAWNPRFGADGRIYFLLEDRGTQRLVSMEASGGAIREETTESVVYDYDLSADGTIAFTAVRPDLPGDVFSVRAGKSRQLTNLNEPLMSSIAIGDVEKIRFESPDGVPLEGFVMKPPGFEPGQKYPAILWIHGGPNEQETGEFYFRPQYFAARGYVVVQVNYRGSTGYGKEFQRAIYKAWGTRELDDLLAGLDHVISLGYVDPYQIGVGGHSYGAILTNYLITKTGRFRAAITDAGESNYLMNYGVDMYILDWEEEVGKPWEDPQKYIDISPYFKLAQVTTPTLVIGGELDWNVPLINSEQLYLSLRRIGVETMLVVYPGEPHGFSRPSYIRDRYLRYASWFDHYLLGKPDRVPPSP